MQVIAHEAGTRRLAEIRAMKLAGATDMMALMLHARIHRASGIIIDETFVSPEFFRLDSGVARQVLEALRNNQNFTLAIVGDISRYTQGNEALQTFVRDANRGRDVRFAATVADVLAKV